MAAPKSLLGLCQDWLIADLKQTGGSYPGALLPGNLSSTGLPDSVVLDVFEELGRGGNITRLRAFYGAGIVSVEALCLEDLHLDELCTSVHLPCCTTLVLSSSDRLRTLSPLQNLKCQLKTLELRGCGGLDAAAVANVASQLPLLEALRVEKCPRVRVSVEHVLTLREALPRLTSLSLSEVGLDDDSALALFDAEAGLTGLRSLSLDGNDLTDAGALVCCNAHRLETLDLRWNGLGVQTIGVMRMLPSLRRLRVGHTKLNDPLQGWYSQRDFSRMLGGLTSLETLDISGNGWDVSPCSGEVESLGSLCSLRDLTLTDSRTDPGEISAMLRHLTSLSRLDASRTGVTSVLVSPFGRQIEGVRLRELILCQCPLARDFLGEIWGIFPNLERLDVSGVPTVDEGLAMRWAGAWQRRRATLGFLTELSMNCTRLTHNGLRELLRECEYRPNSHAEGARRCCKPLRLNVRACPLLSGRHVAALVAKSVACRRGVLALLFDHPDVLGGAQASECASRPDIAGPDAMGLGDSGEATVYDVASAATLERFAASIESFRLLASPSPGLIVSAESPEGSHRKNVNIRTVPSSVAGTPSMAHTCYVPSVGSCACAVCVRRLRREGILAGKKTYTRDRLLSIGYSLRTENATFGG